MGEERNITPEKQLLNLIEDPKAGDPKAISGRAVKQKGLGLLSFGALKGRISFSKNWFRAHGKGALALDLRSVNHLLALALFILCFYLVSNFSTSIIKLGSIPSFDVGFAKMRREPDSRPVTTFTKPSSYYLGKVRQRDIFRMTPVKKISSPAAPSRPDSVKEITREVVRATENLVLVGISWSEDPEVMIEDTKAARTFFLQKGDSIGRVRVEAIYKDKVILKYQGEEIELK